MKYALVNPNWSFSGSTYFGCAEPHIPLELLSAREFLRKAGHEVLVIDAFLEHLEPLEVRTQLDAFGEDFLVIPTAPSYLFWRCPQPELRIPALWIEALRRTSRIVVIGPHGSVTPRTTLEKTGADIVLRGEPDQTLQQLATEPFDMIPGCGWLDGSGTYKSAPGLGATDMRALPTLDFSDYPLERHHHLHHIFPGNGADHLRLGAELEFARGCPYACTFCNKTLFRNKYRERNVDAVLGEIDQLIARGVDYVYFIDEIFGVGKQVGILLEEIAKRKISIGFQSRIDLWDEESIQLLARAQENDSDNSLAFLKLLGEASAVLAAFTFIGGWSYLASYYSAFGLNPLELDIAVPVVCTTAIFVLFDAKWPLVAVAVLILGWGFLTPYFRRLSRSLGAAMLGLVLLTISTAGVIDGRRRAAKDEVDDTSALPSVAFVSKLPKTDQPPCVDFHTYGSLDCKLLLHSKNTYYFFEPILNDGDGSLGDGELNVFAISDSDVAGVHIVGGLDKIARTK